MAQNSGWLNSVRLPDGVELGEVHRRDSPNFDDRPASTAISLLVMHYISLPANKFSGPYVEDFFLNRLDVTAHDSFELKSRHISFYAAMGSSFSLLTAINAPGMLECLNF
jgi:hypothetical protein